ncbi:DUF1285 domain-containing protein [Pontixanthobacter gangjinensis]|uniref:DUF1285 domain-containing protein n=1 Tax=Pontixanthobacter gangjinensis TaxID=1028742 RepID=A0A6I4SM52_9SPHN|nr:DUF1285 domain-containing protein [Pontixanthobacter gangjinensis]MXO56518.1 DUF1285 domain-containing protein [Pontixanthobacter gangjinensis]
MPYDAPPELAGLSLVEVAEQVAQRRLPPVESWKPRNTSDSLMRIAADGKWFHDGGEIKRRAMVRAFSGLLTRDDAGQHWLVTPYERASIEVEDAPFIAVDVAQRDGALAFRLNTDELVLAGAEHRLIARGNSETPALYLHVRHGLEARLNRSTYTQLAEIALAQSDDWQVSSQSETYSLLPG